MARGGASNKAKLPYLPSPVPVEQLLEGGKLIKQGAEARVYKALLPAGPAATDAGDDDEQPSTVLLKHRFPKQYRHPTLDVLLTKQRLTAECRILLKLAGAGVKVPELKVVEVKKGVLGMEWIEGGTVREALGGGGEEDGTVEDDEEEEQDGQEETEFPDVVKARGIEEEEILLAIGREIARLHIAEVVHGDLTTSNMMIRLSSGSASAAAKFDLVMIDFGLSSVSLLPEDRAVDLYVLERAFSSTHPVQPGARPQFESVLEAYLDLMQKEGKDGDGEKVRRRLEDVRLRGRKRSMVG